jgi:hypothetical protein
LGELIRSCLHFNRFRNLTYRQDEIEPHSLLHLHLYVVGDGSLKAWTFNFNVVEARWN